MACLLSIYSMAIIQTILPTLGTYGLHFYTEIRLVLAAIATHQHASHIDGSSTPIHSYNGIV